MLGIWLYFDKIRLWIVGQSFECIGFSDMVDNAMHLSKSEWHLATWLSGTNFLMFYEWHLFKRKLIVESWYTAQDLKSSNTEDMQLKDWT